MTSPAANRWYCAQIGAREHYAIPRALQASGRLATLYTDFWAGTAWRGVLGGRGALATRFHSELAQARVQAWNIRAVTWEARLRRVARDGEGRYLGYADVGRRFATAVSKCFPREAGPGTVFFAYDTGALETLAALRPRGVHCILDQIDPARVEVEIVREEEQRFPGWTLRPAAVPEAYFERRAHEWALADRIVVNSEFSRQALIRQGVPEAKLAIVPLCYEPGEITATARRGSAHTPLRVLFLGQVILRKGIPYVMEAARRLSGEPVHFDVVGPIGISEAARRTAPPNLTFHGRAGRAEAADWYRRSDVFVLPTLSDGFALTQLEAMAHGLPVIATPHCGEVVTPGVDGAIVSARDAEALARVIAGYASDRALLAEHQAAATQKSAIFSLARLGERLAALEPA